MADRCLWDGKPYHSLDYEMKHRFGEKIYKAALETGMTCPNRDGKLDTRGCSFCSGTGSGGFASKEADRTALHRLLSVLYQHLCTSRKIRISIQGGTCSSRYRYAVCRHTARLPARRCSHIVTGVQPDQTCNGGTGVTEHP